MALVLMAILLHLSRRVLHPGSLMPHDPLARFASSRGGLQQAACTRAHYFFLVVYVILQVVTFCKVAFAAWIILSAISFLRAPAVNALMLIVLTFPLSVRFMACTDTLSFHSQRRIHWNSDYWHDSPVCAHSNPSLTLGSRITSCTEHMNLPSSYFWGHVLCPAAGFSAFVLVVEGEGRPRRGNGQNPVMTSP